MMLNKLFLIIVFSFVVASCGVPVESGRYRVTKVDGSTEVVECNTSSTTNSGQYILFQCSTIPDNGIWEKQFSATEVEYIGELVVASTSDKQAATFGVSYFIAFVIFILPLSMAGAFILVRQVSNRPKRIDKSPHGELWHIGGRNGRREVRVSDATGEHVIRVPPWMNTVEQSLRWSYDLDRPYNPRIRT